MTDPAITFTTVSLTYPTSEDARLLAADIVKLVGQRDRARDLAATYEAEIALMRPIVDAALALEVVPRDMPMPELHGLGVALDQATRTYREATK